MIKTQINNERKYRKKEGRIAYLDLFAGPGRYAEGKKSTPLLVLDKAAHDPEISQRLVTLFNDKDEKNVRSLQKEIESFPDLAKLKYQPQIMNQEIGSEIVKQFEEMQFVPTLFFVDPYGYKGLSLGLINSVIKDWGCDAIFFFNYNRISMGIKNEVVRMHMDMLFGQERADKLREVLDTTPIAEKELTIVEYLAQALKEMGGEFVLPFRFRDERGNRTSHHLIFVSKHFRGYEKMKEIMASESSEAPQGVASFEYNPATERQPLLFDLARPLDDLGQMLLETFKGQTLTMQDVYLQHNVGTPYIKSNYKKILWELEESGRISAPKHRKGTFADHIKATFPD